MNIIAIGLMFIFLVICSVVDSTLIKAISIFIMVVCFFVILYLKYKK
jgi:hypothetical protein